MATSRLSVDLQQHAIELFSQGRLNEAAQILSQLIAEEESAELWNDWGALQLRLGHWLDAERAFRAALRLNPTLLEAAGNLGLLLHSQHRKREAIPLLQQARAGATQPNKAIIEQMLEQCANWEDSQPDYEDELASRLPATRETPLKLEPEEITPPTRSQTIPPNSYDDWFQSVFRQSVPLPGTRVCVSWPEDSAWGNRAFSALLQLECEYARELLADIKTKNIPGDIAEFGIFEGWWVKYLDDVTQQLGLFRRVYGFDSFEGLSDPHPNYDLSNWKKGQYSCSLEQVARNINLPSRPRVKLVKGFFEKSLRGADARLAGPFCYVRIDCDIYEPALDCLRYIAPRLADGAILVFDDWPHMRGYGEQRAFEEWLPSVPNLDFEFLFYGVIGHFYMRVHHRN